MTSGRLCDIRNLALVGASGAGKTTLLESLLVAAGAIGSAGSVEKGTSVSDFDPLEKTLGHSLNTSLCHLEWVDRELSLLDTPGTPDLLGRAQSALDAVETALVCVRANGGVGTLTRRVMADASGLCRMLVVTGIDAPGVDLAALLARITEIFGKVCLPINLPTPDLSGVVDCFFAPDPDAATAFSSVRAAHEALIDQVVELDEDLMTVYLEQGESLTPEQLHAPFERALREGHLIPVCFTSARSGSGVRELLDLIAKLMPSPEEGNPAHFLRGEGEGAEDLVATPDPAAHLVAHVFQIANDAYRGKLAIFRIHQGTLRQGSLIFVGDARKTVKVAHLLKLQGKNQMEVAQAGPGEICALARIDEIHRDAVLHDSHDEDRLHRAPRVYPQPVAGLALRPTKLGDEQKLAEALGQLCEEDPCLAVEYDIQGKQTVVRALGQTHLKILCEALSQRWGLKLDTAPPAVPYRETIGAVGQARYRHKKQSGGAGQFGEVELRVEPLARGAGFEFVDQVKGGTIPGQFMPAVEKGVRQALAEGALAGFPVQDLRVVVLDGKHHAVDSNEVSFVSAARHAVLDAIAQSRPQLLEPYVTALVRTRDEMFGSVSGEISARRGRLLGTDSPQAGWTEINSQLPLAEMDGFEARIKSLLAGDCGLTVSFSHYENAPLDIQSRLAKAWEGGEQ